MDSEWSPASAKPKRSNGVGKRLVVIGVVGLMVLAGAGIWRWKSGGYPEDVRAKYKSYYKPPKGFDANQAAGKQADRLKKAIADKKAQDAANLKKDVAPEPSTDDKP